MMPGEIFIYVITYVGLFTSIFFLLTLFENRKKLINHALPKILPKVTILVPCVNEEVTLSKTLHSLLGLNYPKNKLEIIVIDDCSKDKTVEVAKSFKVLGVKVIVRKKNGGKGRALNTGLKHATGDLVGCLDADSVVERDALRKMIGYFNDSQCYAVTPALKCTRPKNTWQRIQTVEFLLGVFLRKVFALLGSIHVTPGPFTIFRMEFFKKHGGYDVSTCTEDIEIALRLQYNNYRIENAPDANVHAIAKPTFGGMYEQRIRWYRGFMDNVLKYKSLFSKDYGNLGLFVLPMSFISVALAIVFITYSAYVFISANIQRLINLYVIGFDISNLIDLNFDLFFLNQSGIIFLGIISMLIGIVMIVLSRKISAERSKLIWDYILFVIFYMPLFAFWWVAAIYHKLTKGEVVWAGRIRSAKELGYLE
jgi:cellulose synthase/poly-beta-1,6-N-acetylglucosamine synthase-like glycosyltransferase